MSNATDSIHQTTELATQEKAEKAPALPPDLLALVAAKEKYPATSIEAVNAGEKSADALWRFLRLGDQVVEVCCFEHEKWKPSVINHKERGNCIAYATSAQEAMALIPRSEQGENKLQIWAQGFYVVPARLRDSATAKYPRDNNWHVAKNGAAKEKDVTRTLVLGIDIDPERADGTNASDAEREGILSLIWKIRALLIEKNVPTGALGLGMSGNGYQLLLGLDIAWSEEVKQQRKRLLAALGAKFGSPRFKVDQTMINGDRYIPLFGTLKRKGPELPGRPWRRNWFACSADVKALGEVEFKELVEAVEKSLTPAELEKLNAKKSAPKTTATGKIYNSHDDKLAECRAVDVAVVARILGIDPANPKCPHPNCGAEGSPSNSSVKHIPEKNIIKCQHGSCEATAWDPVNLVQNYLGVGDLKGNKEGVAKVIDWFVEQGLVSAPEKRGRKPKSYTKEELEQRARRHYTPQDIARIEAENVVTEEDDALFAWVAGGKEGPPPWEQKEGEEGEASTTAWTYGVEEHDALATVRRPLTDAGNAERLMDQCGEDCRYVPEWKSWIVWTGTHWVMDLGSLKMARLALKTVRAVNKEAIAADPKERGAVAGWAHKSEESARLSAMLKVASHMASLAPSRLDKGAWILNCPNGTLDLRTGELLGHERTDYITRVTTVEYDPNADTSLVDAFLARVQPDAEVREYLWRLLGYSLTGDVEEHLLAIHYGPGGANGKSTLLGSVCKIMGEYSTVCPESLLVGDGHEHPTGLMTLRGARLALVSEVERGDRLRLAQVKRLTGGDAIAARGMGENFTTFAPTHKPHLVVNHRPVISDGTDPIWRRVQLIPWDVTIPEGARDKTLPGRLASDKGMLRRLVEGCVDYVRGGMRVPESVRAATREYQSESDDFGDFVTDKIEVVEGIVTLTGVLYIAYTEWCRARGNKFPLKMKSFAAELNKRKVGEGARSGTARLAARSGVRLIGDVDEEDFEISTSGDAAASDDDDFVLEI